MQLQLILQSLCVPRCLSRGWWRLPFVDLPGFKQPISVTQQGSGGNANVYVERQGGQGGGVV